LLAPYGYPNILTLLSPAILPVVINWLGIYPLWPGEAGWVLPAARRLRKATKVNQGPPRLVEETALKSSLEVDQRCAWRAEMEGSVGRVSASGGPAMPALAMSALIKGVWEAMVLAVAARESLEVASQTIGIMELFFWWVLECYGWAVSWGAYRFRSNFLKRCLSTAENVDFRSAVDVESMSHHLSDAL